MSDIKKIIEYKKMKSYRIRKERLDKKISVEEQKKLFLKDTEKLNDYLIEVSARKDAHLYEVIGYIERNETYFAIYRNDSELYLISKNKKYYSIGDFIEDTYQIKINYSVFKEFRSLPSPYDSNLKLKTLLHFLCIAVNSTAGIIVENQTEQTFFFAKHYDPYNWKIGGMTTFYVYEEKKEGRVK